MHKFIYLSPPHMNGFEQNYIDEVFESNWIAPLGPQVTAFEKEMASYIGINGALAVNSGTSAIHLALKLLNVTNNDIVFCSSLTFIGSVNPVLYEGAIPVFIDADPFTWNMSPVALEKAFSWAEKNNRIPKATIIVDLYGHSADYDELLKICARYGVPVIEDSAEALGSTYKDKKCGAFGNYSILSFNGNKIITTSGGGMLLSRDGDSLKKALFWATQSRDEALWYQHSEAGYNYRMSNMLAAIGRAQLISLDERVNARRKVFEIYKRELESLHDITFMPESDYGKSNRWLTVLQLQQKNGKSPIDLINYLSSQNIESRPVWKPMHLQPLFSECTYFTHFDFSVSDDIFLNGICLPSGSSLTEMDQSRVTSAIKYFFR